MLSAEPKVEVDNTYRDLDYSDITKSESNDCFIAHCFEMSKDKYTVARNRLEVLSEIIAPAFYRLISHLIADN